MLLSAFIPESNEGAGSESGQSVKSRDQPVVGLTNSRGNSFAFRVDSIHWLEWVKGNQGQKAQRLNLI